VKIEINNRWDGKVIVSGKYESIKDCLEKNSDADLRGADLRDADLRDANLSYADLSYADLSGAYLRGADLRDADLRDAYLRDADLRDADLSGADLRGADLRDADLRDADLRDADLSGAKNYSENHDIFYELVRRKKVKSFTQSQWSFIGEIAIHRICWDSIKKRFGKKILPVFKVLAKSGFDEYLKRYLEILND